MTQIPVELTDTEWRLKCEEMAKLELRRKHMRGVLDGEEEDWKDRKKDLNAQIDMLSTQIEKLAQEVDSRQEMRDAQRELDMTPDPPSEEPPDESGPEGREPGEDG